MNVQADTQHHGGEIVGVERSAVVTEPSTNVANSTALKTDSGSKSDESSRILFLNGLRGLAALLVVLRHAGYMKDRKFGALGVDMFFVLSAFLLTLILEKKIQRLITDKATRRRWSMVLIDYFSRRFLRVYPLFVIVACILWGLPDDQKTHYFVVQSPAHFDILKVLTFTSGHRYYVFWTLPVEIGYYFLIPILVVSIVFLRRFWWLAVLPLTCWYIYEGFYTHRQSQLPMRPHLSTFVGGSIAAILYTRLQAIMTKHKFVFPRWHRLVLRTIEWIIFAWFVSVCFEGLIFRWWFPYPFPRASGDLFTSVYVCILIVIELVLPGPMSRALEWNVLMFAGQISYSMYLLHTFVVHNPFVMKQPYYDRLLVTLLGTFLLSAMSFYMIEYPLQVLAGRISKTLQRLATPPVKDAVLTKQHPADAA